MRFDPSFWRKCRVTFRWCRITVWFTVFLLLCAGMWLNRVGLPDFLKTRLVRAAHDRGIDLQFSRMRLRFVRGIVADNVRIGGTNALDRPSLSVAEVQLQLNYAALLHRQLLLSALILRHGTFTVPVLPPAGPPRHLDVTDINAQLQLQTNDTWTLDHFSATFAGAQISLSSRITHASELRKLEIYQVTSTGAAGVLRQELNELAVTLDKIHFVGTPQASLIITGDARDLKTFHLRLGARLPAASSPWAIVENAVLDADADSPDTNRLPQLILNVSADKAVTHWADLSRAVIAIHTDAGPPTQIPPAVVRLTAAAVGSRWGGARDVQIEARVEGEPQASNANNAALAWWTNVPPCRLGWSLKLTQLKTLKTDADSLAVGGFWNAPELAITNLSVALGGGHLIAQAALNVVSRELSFTNRSDFDIHVLDDVLTAKTKARLAEFIWAQPPVLSAAGSVILPPWTNRHPDWQAQAQPTVCLDGALVFTNATIMGAKIDATRLRFTYTNLVWNVPALDLVCAKTVLSLSGGENDHTKNYHWHVRGFFDPESVRPFLKSKNARHGFNYVSFAEPIYLDLQLRGTLYDFSSLGAEGEVVATNLAVRGQSVDSVTGKLFYTNRVLEFYNPVLWRAQGAQTMRADKITLDFNRKLILFTNGFSTTDPQAVGYAIGPKTGKMLLPFHFLSPPTVRVNGQVPLRKVNHGSDLADADLTFEILKGAPFRWLKLYAANIAGTLHWQAQSLFLNDVTARLYGGTGTGHAYFDFRPVEHDCDYNFSFVLHDVNLHLLAENASLKTNHLEGILNASVVVTNASSADWHSWNGGGAVSLRDGLLWDVPMFGILSPALNAVSPGLGSSRAKEASGKFIITNGVIYTDSLNIGLSLSRLQYVGTVDLKQNVNARVTAQPLRNTPVVGSVVSTLLTPVSKLFEYRVTGTLKDPKTTPVFVGARLLLFPLHPIRSLEDMFPVGGNSYFTNSPAQK